MRFPSTEFAEPSRRVYYRSCKLRFAASIQSHLQLSGCPIESGSGINRPRCLPVAGSFLAKQHLAGDAAMRAVTRLGLCCVVALCVGIGLSLRARQVQGSFTGTASDRKGSHPKRIANADTWQGETRGPAGSLEVHFRFDNPANRTYSKNDQHENDVPSRRGLPLLLPLTTTVGRKGLVKRVLRRLYVPTHCRLQARQWVLCFRACSIDVKSAEAR